MRFRVVSVPAISTAAATYANANEDMIRFDFSGSFADGDKLAFSWKGNVI